MKFRLFNDRRARLLAQREWTKRERKVVWRGLTGRFAIAIEPLLGVIFMTFLTWGIVYRSAHVPSDHDIIKIAWIFALGAIAFLAYFVAVLVAPFLAYLQTYKPIYIVDGYVRYREPDDVSEIDGSGYVATLFEDRSVVCEWECYGNKKLPNKTIPAHVEFSIFAGIHAIDGKATGVLPEEIPLLAVGIAPRTGKHPD
ncbi:MAG TPA: hypothetical protein VGN11_04390 [Candidatus Baltobacteraceae bacterium]|jgi:hypothetical protein|nr:hypothetical protein [Candidatus Baltobacteraceae bacterium]